MRWLPALPLILALGCLGEASGPVEASQDAGNTADSGASPDAGTSADAGQPDAGLADAGTATPDAGGTDAGATPDAGTTLVAVVVGYGGRRASTIDGHTWEHFQELTPNGGDDENLFRGVGFGGGVFVAVGGSSHGYTLTSTDGITWANENRTVNAWIGNVAWLGGQFVAAGGNGLRIRSTDLGVSWKDAAGYQDIHYRDLTAGPSIAVAAGHTYAGVGILASTSDGVAWTERARGGTSFNHVVYGNGVFVAFGNAGHLAHSSDGLAWTDVDLGLTSGAGLVFDGAAFLASSGSTVYRSTDGASWTPASTNSRSVDGSLFGRYLSLGWPAAISSATTLGTWTTDFSPGGSGLTAFASGRVSR